jgi:hypothetical protein
MSKCFVVFVPSYSLALQILRSQQLRIRELRDQNLRDQQLSLMSYICTYRDLQAGAKLASLSSWSWSSPQFLVKTAHQDTTEQISNPPELRCEQECNRKRRRSYDRCSTSFLQLQAMRLLSHKPKSLQNSSFPLLPAITSQRKPDRTVETSTTTTHNQKTSRDAPALAPAARPRSSLSESCRAHRPKTTPCDQTCNTSLVYQKKNSRSETQDLQHH